MKAYMVYPDKHPMEHGCAIAYAKNRNCAKMLAYKKGPWPGFNYIEFNAARKPGLDCKDKAFNQLCETNEELPDDVPKFFDDEYIL